MPPKLREHLVASGDCLASIAAAARTSLETLWDMAENADLRELRQDPYVLAPGDRVMVPPPRAGTHVLEAGMRHVFRRQATHTDFQVTVTLNGRPRANRRFTLVLDGDAGRAIEGTSDGDGVVRARVPAVAKRGVITFDDGRGRLAFELGALDPIDTTAGIQGRLRALGFYLRAVDGEYGPYTAGALRNFQRAQGIEVTGKVDDATKSALYAAYGR